MALNGQLQRLHYHENQQSALSFTVNLHSPASLMKRTRMRPLIINCSASCCFMLKTRSIGSLLMMASTVASSTNLRAPPAINLQLYNQFVADEVHYKERLVAFT
ncbi:hypothetical protein PIB30_118234 [Stylosanthes scabra]|uniref:Uncharacterized protein n=1 Tax=Stylosanthes scabra TaxID=79078 RepID=A0ABU6ZHP6_9FABA|nr:hypothetical protein [Stylosanthes scabra]